MTPKTIEIFLPSGDPQGTRVSQITTRIVQVIEVPRSLLPEFFKMPESQQVGLYFLVGASEDGSQMRVYIGQTGDLKTRLTAHNRDKDFWERVLILISKTNSLTQTHALYLEWHCLQTASKAERYLTENGNGGSKPHTPAPLEADCLEIFETGQVLLASLGHPIFTPLAKDKDPKKDEIFFCKGPEAEGKGLYTKEGFVVLKDSKARKEIMPSAGTWIPSIREELVNSGVLQEKGSQLIFTRDYLFRTPSGAAAIVLGRRASGWEEWKNSSGKTLDEIKRQKDS